MLTSPIQLFNQDNADATSVLTEARIPRPRGYESTLFAYDVRSVGKIRNSGTAKSRLGYKDEDNAVRTLVSSSDLADLANGTPYKLAVFTRAAGTDPSTPWSVLRDSMVYQDAASGTLLTVAGDGLVTGSLTVDVDAVVKRNLTVNVFAWVKGDLQVDSAASIGSGVCYGGSRLYVKGDSVPVGSGGSAFGQFKIVAPGTGDNEAGGRIWSLIAGVDSSAKTAWLQCVRPTDTTGTLWLNKEGGNIGLGAQSYAWPAAHSAGFLKNDGSGTLSWTTDGIVSGSGTASYLPVWTSSTVLGDSVVRSLANYPHKLPWEDVDSPSGSYRNTNSVEIQAPAATYTRGAGTAWTRSGTSLTINGAISNPDLQYGTTVVIDNTSDVEALPTGSYTITSWTPSSFTVAVSGNGGTSGAADWHVYWNTASKLVFMAPFGQLANNDPIPRPHAMIHCYSTYAGWGGGQLAFSTNIGNYSEDANYRMLMRIGASLHHPGVYGVHFPYGEYTTANHVLLNDGHGMAYWGAAPVSANDHARVHTITGSSDHTGWNGDAGYYLAGDGSWRPKDTTVAAHNIVGAEHSSGWTGNGNQYLGGDKAWHAVSAAIFANSTIIYHNFTGPYLSTADFSTYIAAAWHTFEAIDGVLPGGGLYFEVFRDEGGGVTGGRITVRGREGIPIPLEVGTYAGFEWVFSIGGTEYTFGGEGNAQVVSKTAEGHPQFNGLVDNGSGTPLEGNYPTTLNALIYSCNIALYQNVAGLIPTVYRNGHANWDSVIKFPGGTYILEPSVSWEAQDGSTKAMAVCLELVDLSASTVTARAGLTRFGTGWDIPGNTGGMSSIDYVAFEPAPDDNAHRLRLKIDRNSTGTTGTIKIRGRVFRA